MKEPTKPTTLRSVPFGRTAVGGRSAVSRGSAVARGLLRIARSGPRWLLLGSAVVVLIAVLALVALL